MPIGSDPPDSPSPCTGIATPRASSPDHQTIMHLLCRHSAGFGSVHQVSGRTTSLLHLWKAGTADATVTVCARTVMRAVRNEVTWKWDQIPEVWHINLFVISRGMQWWWWHLNPGFGVTGVGGKCGREGGFRRFLFGRSSGSIATTLRFRKVVRPCGGTSAYKI